MKKTLKKPIKKTDKFLQMYNSNVYENECTNSGTACGNNSSYCFTVR